MNKKMISELKYIFFSLIVTVCFFGCSKKEAINKPNVIYILTDQWRASALGYSGNPDVKTPYLDAFAKNAVNFKNAISVTPVCTPYRASLLTGKYPTTTGIFLNDLYLPKEEVTMAEIYKAAGYKTAYYGKWHLDGHGRRKYIDQERRQGFDYWKASECDHSHNHEHYYENNDTIKKYWKGYSPFSILEDASKYIEEQSTKDKPFLLFLSLTTPHFPHHTALAEYEEMYHKDSLTIPKNVTKDMLDWAKNELVGYYAHATATDKAIGQFIKKLKKEGVYENSIIVFTSDHGEMMGSHGYRPFMKHQPYLESANIPFLISYPKIEEQKGKTATASITTPDILPSLLSLCNIEIPKEIEGYNLSTIIKNPSLQSNKAALFMNICPFGIANNDSAYRALKSNNYTYVKTENGAAMLFDDLKDPLQLNNLIDLPQYKKIQEKLDNNLMSELKRIGEDRIKSRFYYAEKFGYTNRPEIREDFVIKDYFNVKSVISPK